MSYEISRCLEFDSAHRVTQHESKCANVHGHRYKAVFYFTADSLDTVGRVIDYGVIKQLMAPWIEEHLDHGFIGKADDGLAAYLAGLYHKVYLMPVRGGVPEEPTGESIARLLFEVCDRRLDVWRRQDLGQRLYVRLLRVTVWETPNCSATYIPDPVNLHEP